MTTASNWLLNWAIAYSTPYLVNPGKGNADLQAKIFFIWGGCCLICAFFVYGMIYETKGLSLEEVDELYAKVDSAWNSDGFVPTVKFRDMADGDAGDSAAIFGAGDAEKGTLPIADHSSEDSEVSRGLEHTSV